MEGICHQGSHTDSVNTGSGNEICGPDLEWLPKEMCHKKDQQEKYKSGKKGLEHQLPEAFD